MKKTLFCALALVGLCLGACENKKAETTDAAAADTIQAEPAQAMTSEDSLARGEASILTDQILEKIDLGDAASVTDLINQTEAAIREKQKEGNADAAAAFAAEVKTFLKTNKAKLEQLSVDATNITKTASSVEGVDEAIARAKAALEAAKAKARAAAGAVEEAVPEEVKEGAKKAASQAREHVQNKVQELQDQNAEAIEAAKAAAEAQKEEAIQIIDMTKDAAKQKAQDQVNEAKQKVQDQVNAAKQKAAEALRKKVEE